MLAALWRQITPEDKKVCEDIANQDRDRYYPVAYQSV